MAKFIVVCVLFVGVFMVCECFRAVGTSNVTAANQTKAAETMLKGLTFTEDEKAWMTQQDGDAVVRFINFKTYYASH